MYNEGIYIIRQEFIKTGKWISYSNLYHLLKTSENFKILPHNTAQQILILVEKAWKSFFKAMKEYKKHPEKFVGKPSIPGYKLKDGEFVLPFSTQQIKIKNRNVQLPKKINIEVKTRLSDDTVIGTSTIIPKGIGFILNVVYKKMIKPPITITSNILGIDIGLNNIVTIVDNIGSVPIIVKGGVVKSINQFFNKRKAELQSLYDLSNIKGTPKKLSRLLIKRDLKINDFFHKTSRKIVEICKTNNIGTIVIGHNEGWKQNCKMGKRNNQNFVSVPFDKLIKMIKYKGEEEGINTMLVNESHTSKCSFLDGEGIKHQDSYAGKRTSRGMFVSRAGIKINADVNAAYNIIKKAIPNAYVNGIEGVGLHPVRLGIY
ncbi:TPA_asm: transposase [Altiarchaeum virus]|nr:TPA_asm: transposase [Altiarchaeum virus]